MYLIIVGITAVGKIHHVVFPFRKACLLFIMDKMLILISTISTRLWYLQILAMEILQTCTKLTIFYEILMAVQ